MGSTNSRSAYFNFNYDAYTGNGSMVLTNGWDNIQYTITDSLITVQIPDSFGPIDNQIVTTVSDNNGIGKLYWLVQTLVNRTVTIKFTTATNPDPIRFIAIARTISSSYNITLNTTGRLIASPEASFDFNYVPVKTLTAINSNIDQSGNITYANKPVMVGSSVDQEITPLADFRVISLQGLSNDASFFRTDVNLVTTVGTALTASEISLSYDASLCPNITSMVLVNGIIVVTSNIPIPTLFINQNVNSATLNIPGTLQFNITYSLDRMQAFITPSKGTFNDLMASGDALNFSLLITAEV